jgi:beta-N-acetylhexosaminidase
MKTVFLILSLILMFTGCAPFKDEGARPSPMRSKAPEDPLNGQIDNMTLSEKAGQLVIVGMDGYDINENTRLLVEEKKVGGFVLFGKNIESSEQLLGLINALKSLNSKNKVPIFAAVDEEGGSVSRMPGEFEKLPANREIGELNNTALCFEIGKLLADEIKAFGYNMNFAPVLDINSNPQNTVIGNRAFGDDAEIVRRLGVSTMKGIKSGGVISVVKHFPGHGDTLADSHAGLPIVNHNMDRLNAVELVPFKDAVRQGADAVMVAHILMNKIDGENPATMSGAVVTGILRRQMGFEGVIITDDMTMGAITQNYDIGEAAVKAFCAGADIILVCHGNDNQFKVINALENAIISGTISKERLNESLKRILKLKQMYSLKDETIDHLDIEKTNQHIRDILKNNF